MVSTQHINILNIIGNDTPLKRVASTNGGEYAGPCPFCGGEDRFHVWPNADTPRYWCRICDRKGDAITYLRERDNLSFAEACEVLRVMPEERPRTSKPTPKAAIKELDTTAPAFSDPDWQWYCNSFVRLAHDTLVLEPWGERARHYLYGRGLSDATIESAQLGYNPCEKRLKWGNTDVWLPEGIVIPWHIGDELWTANIRRFEGTPKYVKPAGSANGLYRVDSLKVGDTALLVEGEFDALIAAQSIALPGITPLATGGVQGSKLLRWIAELALADRVLIAFDADEAGEKAADWWLAKLGSRAIRVIPEGHDITDMHLAGIDLNQWLAPFM